MAIAAIASIAANAAITAIAAIAAIFGFPFVRAYLWSFPGNFFR